MQGGWYEFYADGELDDDGVHIDGRDDDADDLVGVFFLVDDYWYCWWVGARWWRRFGQLVNIQWCTGGY